VRYAQHYQKKKLWAEKHQKDAIGAEHTRSTKEMGGSSAKNAKESSSTGQNYS